MPHTSTLAMIGSLATSLSSLAAADRAPEVITLVPAAPGTVEQIEDRSTATLPDLTLLKVGETTLTITWPRQQKNPAPAVLILPGGGYGKLVIDKEGHSIARWLNDHGYVAAVLKYRLPRADLPREEIPWPVRDATEALRLLRLRAAEWGISAVGVLGSSAGGHLAATLSTHYDLGDPQAEDPLARQSSRPDFQILLYPVISFTREDILHGGSRRNLLGEPFPPAQAALYSNESQVTGDTPPAFITHAVDDTIVPVDHSRLYAAKLREHGVPCEYLELPTGGHGFGLAVQGGDPVRWPPAGLAWLAALPLPSSH